MLSVFFIAKRTLKDILRTGVFWGALALAAFICFATLYWGWRSIEREAQFSGRVEHRSHPGFGDGAEGLEMESEEDPFGEIDPRMFTLWLTYGGTIGFSNLLGIFIMIGLLSRDIENRRIDMLLARPVSRTQIYFGKLIGGWCALILFLVLIVAWSFVCMELGGMGVQPKYLRAVATGAVSPLLIASLTLFMSLWMRGLLAGLIATVMTFGASTTGIFVIYMLGAEVLKLRGLVWVVFKLLPPLSVIGSMAGTFLEKDLKMRFIKAMFEEFVPESAGLYTEPWHVAAYFAVVVFLGWLSLYRRQFT